MRKLWDFSSWMYFCIFIFQTLSFESYNPYLSAILGMHGLSFWKTRFIWWLGGGGRFQIQPQELAEKPSGKLHLWLFNKSWTATSVTRAEAGKILGILTANKADNSYGVHNSQVIVNKVKATARRHHPFQGQRSGDQDGPWPPYD